MYNSAIKILNILYENGYDSYIVGGFVRDKLLGIKNDDIDIITNATSKEISNIFNIDIKDNYGSIKLKYNNYIYDITTFRKEDNYLDNRRPNTIEFVKDVKEDLLRRDFTINTILIDKDENIIDYLDGIKDLNNKTIKSVGDPNKKINEDSLRILRAFRFMCIYDFKLDKDLYESIKDNKDLINNLSFDRIKKELDYIFKTSKVNLFINVINKLNLFKTLEIKPINSVIPTCNNLSIWAQLEYSDKYNFSNKEKEYIKNIKYILENGIDNYTVYKYGIDINKEANKILNKNIDIELIYNNLPIKNKTDIDISINDIKDKSKINDIYIELEKEILYNKLSNKKKDIISYLEGDNVE